jgi:hypothetical protein
MAVLPALQQQRSTERSHHFGTGLHMPLQQTPVEPQSLSVTQTVPATALFSRLNQANTMPTSPIPNLFSAARRVTARAICFVSSSNLLFITFLCCFEVLNTNRSTTRL